MYNLSDLFCYILLIIQILLTIHQDYSLEYYLSCITYINDYISSI